MNMEASRWWLHLAKAGDLKVVVACAEREGDRIGKELAQGPAVGVAVLIELHPLHGFVVKRKRPGVGAWVTC